MRRVLAIGCLLPAGLFLTTFLMVGGWQLFESAANPAVAAIHRHPVAVTGTVVTVGIDGFGGDPAVDYAYAAAGRTFYGHDVASAATGNVLDKKAGDPIPVQYAAEMPEISCVAASTDCPNNVFATGLFTVVFWTLALVIAIGAVLVFAGRAVARRLRRNSRRLAKRVPDV